MVSSQPSQQPKVDRRQLLRSIAATAATASTASIATGTDVSSDSQPPQAGPPDADLAFGVPHDYITTFDKAAASFSRNNMVLNLIYGQLRRQAPDGTWYNWMAKEFEVTDANDVSVPDDYVAYMAPYQIQSIANVGGGIPRFNLDSNNLPFPTERTAIGITAHPDDIEAFQNGELGVGDDMRIFTRNEAPTAVADGTYGLKIEGELHEGITFHNGAECTAADVVGSPDRYAGTNYNRPYFDTFLYADAPDGPDGYTFELYAHLPDAIAPVALQPTVFPEPHHDIPLGDLDPREGGPMPIGTGPYELDGFEDGESILLKRTDNYWVQTIGVENLPFETPPDFNNRPVPPIIELQFLPDDSQRATALQDGDIDVTYSLPPADNTALLEDGAFTTAWARSARPEFMQFSVQDTDQGGAFAQQAVRHAVNALTPRWGMVNTVDDGWAIPGRVPFPKDTSQQATTESYKDAKRRWWANSVEPDPERAADLLDRAGVDPPVEMTIETNADGSERQDRVQLFVDALNASGLFDATMETPAALNPWFVNDLIAPDSEQDYAERNATAYLGMTAPSVPDPHYYVQNFHHPDRFKRCCNMFHPAGTFGFIDLLDSCRYGSDVAMDPELRRQRYDQLWARVAAHTANPIINYDLNVVVSSEAIEGFAAHSRESNLLSYALYAPYDGRIARPANISPPGAAPIEQKEPPSTGEPEEPAPLPHPPIVDVTLDGFPATDTTGDGLLNDVDGDGEFTIFDVQTLFNQFDDPVVQANPEGAFAFNTGEGADASDPVGIFDVQALFEQLQDTS